MKYGLVEEVQGHLRLSEAEVGNSRRVLRLSLGKEDLLDDSYIPDAGLNRRSNPVCAEFSPIAFRLHSSVIFRSTKVLEVP